MSTYEYCGIASAGVRNEYSKFIQDPTLGMGKVRSSPEGNDEEKGENGVKLWYVK